MKTKGTVKWFQRSCGLDLSGWMAETMFVHYLRCRATGSRPERGRETWSPTSFRAPRDRRRPTC